ncbi:hypothetical protein M422DRAFT_242261 [Sphaerobolus stellatus SS14]|nr:hypothetical protein M422DRAFT_242261 [Sphaerobolus stellatus SS14]
MALTLFRFLRWSFFSKPRISSLTWGLFISGKSDVYSLQEPLLAKFGNLKLLHRTHRKEKIELIHTFHSLHEFSSSPVYHNWDNVPLGGIIVDFSSLKGISSLRNIPPLETQCSESNRSLNELEHLAAHLRDEPVFYSSWGLDHNNGGVYFAHITAKVAAYGKLMCSNSWKTLADTPPHKFPPNRTSSDGSAYFGTILLSFLVERRDLYPAFLEQINFIDAKLKEERLTNRYNQYTFNLCHRIRWTVDIPPNGVIKRKDSTDVFLCLENRTIDESGYAQDPQVYWSTCPSGTMSLTVLQAYSLGIESFPIIGKQIYTMAYTYNRQKDILRTITLPDLARDPARFYWPGNLVQWETAEAVPSFLQFYDLRTTGHELKYGNLDIDLIHTPMPRCIKEWSRPWPQAEEYDMDMDTDWDSEYEESEDYSDSEDSGTEIAEGKRKSDEIG